MKTFITILVILILLIVGFFYSTGSAVPEPTPKKIAEPTAEPTVETESDRYCRLNPLECIKG